MSNNSWFKAALACGLVMLTGNFGGTAGAQTKPYSSDLQSQIDWVKAKHLSKFPLERFAVKANDAKVESNVAVQGDVAQPEWNWYPRYRNDRVNQDRNPYSKVITGVAVDPTDPHRIVVSTDDVRMGDQHSFFHFSQTNGERWRYDVVPTITSRTGSSASQASAGIGFNRKGHTFIAITAENDINDPTNGYLNEDTTVAVVPGLNHGTYAGVPIILDSEQCSGLPATGPPQQCNRFVYGANLTTDLSGTATDGRVYVAYTFECDDQAGCGAGAFPFGTSVFLSNAYGPGQPIEGPVTFGFGNYGIPLVDGRGNVYVFVFVSSSTQTSVYQATLNGGYFDLSENPILSYTNAGLNNPNWKFLAGGFSCATHTQTAYCAFMATQVGSGPVQSTPDIYLAAINLQTGTSTVNRVNNDPLGNGKDHFGSSSAVTPNGDVYVEWFDDRRDPTNKKVDVFLGKSSDGGKTFPIQRPINDVSFDPNIGGVGPSSGMAAGSDGVVHPVWTDSRDGVPMQVWSEEEKW